MPIHAIVDNPAICDVYQITSQQVDTIRNLPAELNPSQLPVPISHSMLDALHMRLNTLKSSLDGYNKQGCLWKILNMIMSIFTGVFCNVCILNRVLSSVIDDVQKIASQIASRSTSIKEQIVKQIKDNNPVMKETSIESLDKMLKDDADTSYSHVILDDDQKSVKGFVVARENEDSIFNKAPAGTKVAVMEKLCVVPECRKNGLGKKLLHTMAERALERHIDQLRLLVYKVNTVAIKFYLKCGFTYDNYERDAKWDAYVLIAKPQILHQKTAPTG